MVRAALEDRDLLPDPQNWVSDRKAELATADRLANCIALCCVVVRRVSWLTMLSAACSNSRPRTESDRNRAILITMSGRSRVLEAISTALPTCHRGRPAYCAASPASPTSSKEPASQRRRETLMGNCKLHRTVMLQPALMRRKKPFCATVISRRSWIRVSISKFLASFR